MEGRHSKTAGKATEPPSGGMPSKRLPSKKAGLGELEQTHVPSTLPTGKPFTRIPTTSTSFMEAGLGGLSNISRRRATSEPYIEITEQPKQRDYRFRYPVEGRQAGSIAGERSASDLPSYPCIKVPNLNGRAKVVVSLVTKTDPPLPHPHRLVGDSCRDGVCTKMIDTQRPEAVFRKIGVQRTMNKDVENSLAERKKAGVRLSMEVNKGKTGKKHNYEMKAVRLFFEVYIETRESSGVFDKYLEPVTSTAIYDKKDAVLSISRVNISTGSMEGGDELFILCEKVQSDDIKVKFYGHDPDTNQSWTAFGDFSPNDVHRQFAIVCKTPKFVNQNIKAAVTVNFHLYRPSDDESSSEMPFIYTPRTINSSRNQLTRERYLDLSRDDYSLAAYFIALETLGKDVVRKGSVIGETLSIGKTSDTSISSSYLAAIGLFTLQNLRYLAIYNVDLEDDFYKGMCAASPQSKIKRLTHVSMATLGPDASLYYARGLFSMPNLQSLKLDELELSDEFYSCMATEASKSKIASFTHDTMFNMATLGPDASLNFARGLFSMPNLQSLTLEGPRLSDEFYSCMETEASKSKIERFAYDSMGSLGPVASLHFTRGLFSMPNLQSLILMGLRLSDVFYSSMGSEASKSKIQTLDMKNVSMTQRILHTLLSLPCLQSLRLEGIDDVDKNDKEMLVHTSHSTSIEELSLDGRDVTTLWKLGLHTSCPQVQKLNLHSWKYKENVSSGIVTMACSPFRHLTHLNIQGFYVTIDPESFSIAVITSCPQLTKLSLNGIELGNEKATKIIQSMKPHPHLSSIELYMCETDKGLDPLIAKVNSEGKLIVTVSPQESSSEESSSEESSSEESSSEESSSEESSSEEFSSDDLVGATAGIHIHEDDETDTQEEENEGETKEVEEDQYSATANFPDETVPDEDNVPPIEMECHKSVGVEGEKLQLDSFGIELEIPPGAIDSEKPQEISLRVLTDTPNLGDSKEEMSVCFGVQCLGPDGMVLKSPVAFTIPHCAIISRPYGIKAVLYCGEGKYMPGAVVKERIELPLSGTPSCIIMEDVLKFRVNHFSWWFFTFSKNDSLQGKRLCCLPMVCTKMPVERTPIILHAHLYNDVKGNTEYAIQRWIKEFFSSKESWLEDELKLGYEKVHSEAQILIEPSEVDLTVVCSVNKGTPEKEILSYKKICKLNHNCMAFELDLRNQPDRVAVLLKVAQDDDETKLRFYIEFTPYKKVKEQKSSDKESKLGQAKPAGQDDFDEMLKIVAKKVVKGIEIDNLGKALGFDPEAISVYIATNNKGHEVTCEGTLSMLRDWRKEQTKNTEYKALKDALRDARQIRLADDLFGSTGASNKASGSYY